jgi:hypothetical protein
MVIVGVAIVAIAKAIVLKFILIDQPLYDKCLSSISNLPNPALACGVDPFTYFIIGWAVLAVGAIILIFGLKVDDMRTRISR